MRGERDVVIYYQCTWLLFLLAVCGLMPAPRAHISTVVLVTFVRPAWLVALQKYKHTINGPVGRVRHLGKDSRVRGQLLNRAWDPRRSARVLVFVCVGWSGTSNCRSSVAELTMGARVSAAGLSGLIVGGAQVCMARVMGAEELAS